MAEPPPDENEAAERRLIVYGSLVPGGPNHARLADLSGTWRAGWVTGELVATGWGAELGFPALRWREDGPRVPAHLLESDALPALWNELDAFEGAEYRRLRVPFFLDEETRLVGQIYVSARE